MRHDEPRQDRRVLQPRARRDDARHSRLGHFAARRDRCRDRARSGRGPAGGVASHITVVTTIISTTTDTQALPEEDRVRERDDPARARGRRARRCRGWRAEARPASPSAARRIRSAPAPTRCRDRENSPPRARGSRRPSTRRAISRASTALKIRLKPQFSHELASANTVTSATAPRGVVGHPATARITRRIGREVAST